MPVEAGPVAIVDSLAPRRVMLLMVAVEVLLLELALMVLRLLLTLEAVEEAAETLLGKGARVVPALLF